VSGTLASAVCGRGTFPAASVTWGKNPHNTGQRMSRAAGAAMTRIKRPRGGAVITQDCSACHNFLATDEANPEVLKDLNQGTDGTLLAAVRRFMPD
jgi:mono/diheme cytochrome c family protein